MQMKSMTPLGSNHEEEAEPEFVPMTAQQAQAWRQRHQVTSPWRVVGIQSLVGLASALVAWLFTGSKELAMSVAYGALAVILPAVLFARGLSRQRTGQAPMAAVLGFFVWEMAKLALTVAMLFAAPRLVVALSWPGLLVGLVLTMKVYWVLLALRKSTPRPQV